MNVRQCMEVSFWTIYCLVSPILGVVLLSNTSDNSYAALVRLVPLNVAESVVTLTYSFGIGFIAWSPTSRCYYCHCGVLLILLATFLLKVTFLIAYADEDKTGDIEVAYICLCLAMSLLLTIPMERVRVLHERWRYARVAV